MTANDSDMKINSHARPELMEDPVINAAGQTYGVPQTPCTACPPLPGVCLSPTQLPAERAAIEKWIARGKRTDPKSGQNKSGVMLEHTYLLPNVALRSMMCRDASRRMQ